MLDDQPIMDASVRWYVDRYCAENALAVVGIPHAQIIHSLHLKPTLGPDPTFEEISADWPVVLVTFHAVPAWPPSEPSPT